MLSACSPSVKEDEHFLLNLMKTEPAKFQNILNPLDSIDVQIIYTQINRDANNRPIFSSFYFHVDSTRYFYPASTIKLPLVLLSLEKLSELNIKGLSAQTPMFHDSVYSGQRSVKQDLTSASGLPSIAHYAKEILMVSDNGASNCLYEFMGQRAVNERLHQKGYTTRILHRLSRSLTPDQNRHTEAIRFVRNDTLVYHQPMLVNHDSIRPMRQVFKGNRHMENDKAVDGPFDFTYKNHFPLQDQQAILKSIIFPESVEAIHRFNITSADRKMVLQYMSEWPRESSYPPYKTDTALYDGANKFLMYALDRKPIPSGIRIFNKIGGAYGYLLDNAYIVDFDNGVEFMLTAMISTNRDGNYNDDHYEYDSLGYPFLKNLGQLVYRYELKRKKERIPELEEFRLTYD